MKCTNKIRAVLFASICTLLNGCGKSSYEIPYAVDSNVSSFRVLDVEETAKSIQPFAADLCVVEGNMTNGSELVLAEEECAGLFDRKQAETLYAKNVYERMAPASLTKVLTTLVALKNAAPDMMLTASENVRITESGAVLIGLKQGDQMTLAQALHILLIYSANDVAVMIAEGVAGSVEGFSALMNEEARSLGATNSNFVNPHGLNDEEHYTTVYDMYLILNEAFEYELFNEIIGMSTYTTTYTTGDGEVKEVEAKNSNLFLHDEYDIPENITVLGGKTGTTNAAGYCLVLVSKDTSGNPYFSIVLKAESRDELYRHMSGLLGEIKN